jgi:acetylornithine deacetylase/succinyl-diaminopimelate desuccinylase-like protein
VTLPLATVLDECQGQFDRSLERLFELLRIPSISTDPAHAGDVRRAAEWLVTELSGLGFDASVRPTAGHPMVVAHADGPPGTPHVLFYAHYDVQPADPLSAWTAPPFAPALSTGEDGIEVIAGRGASDDKGQLMTFVEACRAWRAAGGLPVRVTLLLEGEEESGSKSLAPFLEAHRQELAADVALICDTGMWDRQTPAITAMLRGLVAEEIEITAASRDLHSGMYGGAARNPIHLLAAILADLHDADGRVTLDGFYDGVDEPADALKATWAGLGFDEREFLGAVGLSVPAGESGRPVLEQIWARPTAEVNGIWGGYTGAGFKTVIPGKASAKISFRLVGRQDPAKVREAFRAFVEARLPADCSVAFTGYAGNPAVVLPAEGEWLAKATAALAEEWGRPAPVIGSGGSIPVAGDFKRLLGLDSLMIGFSHDDDRIHSPNEKYDLDSYRRGIRSWARILGAFAG